MKIGIVADNYKLPTFEKALEKAGFKYTKTPFVKKTTTIHVETDQSRFDELHQLVKKAQIDSKNSN